MNNAPFDQIRKQLDQVVHNQRTLQASIIAHDAATSGKDVEEIVKLHGDAFWLLFPEPNSSRYQAWKSDYETRKGQGPSVRQL